MLKPRLTVNVTRSEPHRLAATILLCALVWGPPGPAHGEDEIDFTELSIEDLSKLSIYENTGNVLSSHLHQAGEWMVRYDYRYKDMDGNRDGGDKLSLTEVLADFPMAPVRMSMEMHMLSLMYAPTDSLTLMAMVPYKKMSMDHVTRTGMSFKTRSEGVGDLSLMGNAVVFRKPRDAHRVTLMGGLSLPTGSIDKRDNTPAGADQQLPYPMQLGSGTYDLLFGGSYLGLREPWLWGANVRYTKRLGENDRDYTLGDQVDGNAWLSHGWTRWLSTSVGVHAVKWHNIDGADPALNPMMMPTADPKRQGGERVDLLLSVELFAAEGTLEGNRLTFEAAFPIHQSLHGPQLETDFSLRVGWQWVF
jgi:hypothetical protein